MENNYFTPKEVIESNITGSPAKTGMKFWKILLYGILAGMFISIGAQASSLASHAVTNPGLAKVIAGVIFPVGLMMILVVGGHLFTGNCLLFMGFFDRKISGKTLTLNLLTIFFSNFIGAILISFLVWQSGQWDLNAGHLGAYTIKVAVGKLGLTPMQAITSGIMCNIIVCLAILMAGAAKDITGKCVASFFAIFAFVVSGFEHCVANMYYLTAGFMASSNNSYVEQAKELYGLTESQISSINVGNIFVKNLIPVTVGNIIGGGIIIGGICWLVYAKKEK